MYKLIETQMLSTGETTSMSTYSTLDEAYENFFYKLYYAYNQKINARVTLLGPNDEYMETRSTKITAPENDPEVEPENA